MTKRNKGEWTTAHTDIEAAINNADVDALRQLLIAVVRLNPDFNINAQKYNGKTLLHTACEYSGIPTRTLARRNGKTVPVLEERNKIATDMANEIFNHGGDINIEDKHHNTPLYYAIDGYNEALVDLCLKHKPLMSHQCEHGQYYTEIADNLPMDGKSKTDIVKALKKESAKQSVYPYQWLREHGELLEAIQNKTDRNFEDVLFDCVQNVYFSLNARDEKGNTILHYLAEDGNTSKYAVEILLANGSNPNIRNRQDKTPFTVACEEANFEVIERLLQDPDVDTNVRDFDFGQYPLHYLAKNALITEEIVEGLKRHKTDFNVTGKKLETPIMLLCSANEDTFNIAEEDVQKFEDIIAAQVELLANAGADINLKDFDGDTAFNYACNKHVKDTVANLMVAQTNMSKQTKDDSKTLNA